MKTKWSPWTSFSKLEKTPIPGKPGVYMVATKKPFHRVIGTDPSGILHMGESASLKERIWSFWRCASQRGRAGHMAGWRFAEYRMDNQFPLNTLYFRWWVAKSKQEAYKLEGEELANYFKKHCELPPLNYKFNWSTRL